MSATDRFASGKDHKQRVQSVLKSYGRGYDETYILDFDRTLITQK